MIGANKKLLQAASGTGVPAGSASFFSPGTYYWEAPPGVTSIKNLQGRGGSGATVSSWANVGSSYFGYFGPTTTKLSALIGPTLTREMAQSQLNLYRDSLNNITTSPSGANYSNVPFRSLYYYWSGDNQWYRLFVTLTGLLRRTGTYSSPNAGSGTITLPAPFTFLYNTGGTIQRFTSTYQNGGSSSAFGITFPADSAVQNYETISNIVPGQIYEIVVGASYGSLNSYVLFEWGG